MSQGLPPPPTCRHILGGFLLFALLCAGFFALPGMVKWAGAALTFLPAQLGLIDVVSPDEVIPIHAGENPSRVHFEEAGNYVVFTVNYDLLSINDAVVAARGKPWIRVVDPDGTEVEVTLVERGMAFYDTPFARGRPVARFRIPEAGDYDLHHPTRNDYMYIVPDRTFGAEGRIVFWMLVQAGIVGAVAAFLVRRRRRLRARRLVPPPTAESRARYVQESQLERPTPQEDANPDALFRPWAVGNRTSRPEATGAAAAPERDLLAELHQGRVTAHDAEVDVEHALMAQGSRKTDWSAKLGISIAEAAAYSQGASLRELAGFRYDGWPQACVRCGHAVSQDTLDWWFVRDERGQPGLRHIECPRSDSD